MKGFSFVVVPATFFALRAEAKPSAAELRRWDGSSNCSGDYTVLNTDKMDECNPFLIPAPASLKIQQVNDTAYASYHYKGVTDCSGDQGKHIADWVVGTCEDLGGFSQKRVWIETPPPPPATCEVPGDCGRAYQACCLASELKGNGKCTCHLRKGSGEAGSTDCGFCGRAFVTCCAGFRIGGSPCGCDVADGSVGGTASAASLVV